MIQYIHCSSCNKQVSSGFEAVPADSFKIKAWIQCNDCLEEEYKMKNVKTKGLK